MKLVFALLAVAFCAGCTSVTTRKPPGLDLSRFHHIFVERRLNENHHLDEILVDELRRNGRQAESGPLTMLPDDADAVLTYDARWTWDFKTYLIELNVELHTAHTIKKLAEGRVYQPSARPKPPEEAIRELVAKLLAK